METVIAFITTNAQAVLDVVVYVIAAASTVAALTPTPKDDAFLAKVLGFVRKIANLLALNILNAKVK